MRSRVVFVGAVASAIVVLAFVAAMWNHGPRARTATTTAGNVGNSDVPFTATPNPAAAQPAKYTEPPDQRREPPSDPAHPAERIKQPESAELVAVRRAASADVDNRTAEKPLIAGLASSDPAVVLEALASIAERKLVSALPAVSALDVTRPLVGPSVIATLATLGKATGNDPAVVARLLALLAEEKVRFAAGAEVGVLLHLYEALGELGDPAAAPALEAELGDVAVPRSAKHVVVASLGRIGQRRSLPALVALRASLQAPETEAMDEAIRQELIAEVDRVAAVLAQ